MDTLVRWSATFDDTLTSVLIGPAYNLVNLDNIAGFVIAWALLALYYWLLYYRVEMRFWNSIDGYIDARRSALFAFLLYYLTSMLLIAILHGPMLAQKSKLAAKWRKGNIRAPLWLQSAIDE